ncbi:AMP-binding protein [Acinetobacter johnsonii]|uniref:AMP-binding protein n=1 Tax=Acinetobacter johnsonii TaxID=40214 RepID=UPI00309DED71
MKTLFDTIHHHAVCTPNLEAIITDSTIVTYKGLDDVVDQLYQELLTLNSQKLAIWGMNSIDWIYIDLAAKKAQITVIPIPLFFSPNQILHLIQDSAVDTIFIGSNKIEALEVEMMEFDWLETLYAQKRIHHDLQAKNASGRFVSLKVEPSAQFDHAVPSKITYTSGSTGTPKGVCLGEDTIQSITESLSHALASSHLGRHLCLIPFATLLENIAGIYVAFNMGRSVVVGNVSTFGLVSNNEFKVDRFAHAVQSYQIESVILLPQMLKAMVEYIHQFGATVFKSLKFIAVGGGKVSSDLLMQSEQLHLPVYEGYGLSECASVVSLNLPNARKIGSVGKPLPHVKVKISDQGEVVVRGNAMQGYLNDASIDPLIHTGDAGFFDDEGFLFITGRIKQIIVSSFGRNISPEWVESNGSTEREINQIAIFGEAQPYLSAVIYAKEDVSDSMLEHAIHKANTRMPDYAQIKQWCRSKEPFSLSNQMLTDNGKLRRNEIQKQFKRYL